MAAEPVSKPDEAKRFEEGVLPRAAFPSGRETGWECAAWKQSRGGTRGP